MSTASTTTPPTQSAMLAQQDAHLRNLTDHWQTALARFGYDGVWLSAGEAQFNFQDDHGPKFVPNPYLSQWVDPQYLSPSARLFVKPGQTPVLFLLSPTDYWHAPAPLPHAIENSVDVRTFEQPEELLQACQQEMQGQQQLAHIGPQEASNETFGELNPEALLNYLHFHRARKSEHELIAMRLASDVGARGHIAAQSAFRSGGTEFDIHMAFLQASQQSEVDLPYGNIVALNEHAAVLHYQFQDRQHKQASKSLLIDAGGKYRGFASDITRTYVGDDSAHSDFRALVELVLNHQRSLIDSVEVGMTFADLHVQMHQQLAQVLVDASLVTSSAEAAFSEGITQVFCPHGLGHLLGLQVHDVGGHLADEQGRSAPPPPAYPTLRFTRAIEQDQVFTIEPGLYFIPSLLAKARAENKAINWATVESLSSYGGIRIEDNVRVLDDGVENLTKDAFSRVMPHA